MTAILARSAAPPYALRVWITDTAVFTEIPGKAPAGLPHVMSFPLHEGGLSKALNILRERKVVHYGRDVSGEPWVAPAVIASNAHTTQGSETQRAHAQAVLRRMGII